jgi:hypothetical protein
MNERIKELREQAGDFATETYSKYTMATFDTNKSIETLFEEKFAELIVLECAEIANAGLTPDEDYLIGNDILKHFGVEQE